MRKADYALLAEIIRAKSHPACEPSPDTLSALRAVAECFASRASVNKAEFLKACGIEP